MSRIISQINMSLEESLEIERLEERMEMLVLSTPLFAGTVLNVCDKEGECDDKGCDDTGCDAVGCDWNCDCLAIQ